MDSEIPIDKDLDITRDTLFDGDLICCQNAVGYRYSVDSVLLAHFLKVHTNDRILDLGTGCGIISLILLYRWGGVVDKVTGIEIQRSLATLAKTNLQENKLESKGKIIEGNIKNILDLVPPESYNKVVCNPPFYKSASGRQNNSQEATLARHQVHGNLEDFLSAAAAAVRNRGDVYFIYPAELISEFIVLARNYKLEVKRLQFIYSYPCGTNGARLVLIQCIKNGGVSAQIMDPFYIYSEKNGAFSTEMLEYYQQNNP